MRRNDTPNRVAFIFIGQAGVGKGEQGELVIEQFGLPRFSSSDALRKEQEKNPELKQQMDTIRKIGGNISPEFIITLTKEYFDSLNAHPALFDGIMRHPSEKESLEYAVELGYKVIVIHMKAPIDLLDARLVNRVYKILNECGVQLTFLTGLPPTGKTDAEIKKVSERIDQRNHELDPDVRKRRFSEYQNALDAIEIATNHGLIHEIHDFHLTNEKPLEVFEMLRPVFEKHLSRTVEKPRLEQGNITSPSPVHH